ncbi:hypothetical protein ACFSQJ_13040 [Croceitalea marina]|uniref:Uncharacterized protein n=1 Tax=Croceitalea marina TaxID=1775166 RepID=A0ABW5MZG4_9FLAO
MDKKIQRLIDGSSELARHFNSEDPWYWKFPKEYIDNNKHLRSFLEINKDVQVISLFKKKYPSLDTHGENYKVPLVNISDEEFIVHDSVRYILYNYCISLLHNDLKQYCSNVRNTPGLRRDDNGNERYSYPYPDEFTVRDLFLNNINCPLALNNLITRNFNIRTFLGGRHTINLGYIEMLIKNAEETYDYSKLEF